MPHHMQWWIHFKNKIKHFNLFQSQKRSEEDLKTQRLATQVFCTLLFSSIFALLLYASLISVTRTVFVKQPSLSVYDTLQQRYPETLVCPCQQILISYEAFISSFEPRFNQICSSDFITTDWLNYVNYRLLPDQQYHLFYDFRHSAYSFFNMLNLMCQLVSAIIDDQLIAFYSTSLVTENVISRAAWGALVNASKDQFVSTVANSFLTSLNSFTAAMQNDNIANQLETNWRMTDLTLYGTFIDVAYVRTYFADNGCACESYSQCKMTTGIYNVYRHNFTYVPETWPYNTSLFQGQLEFEVEGVNVGCYTLAALLQSNLSCLYNISCLTQLYTHLHDSPHPINTRNIKPLNISSSLSVLPTVQKLVENLLVDEWQLTSSFDLYFTKCNTLSCTYTYAHRFDVIFVVTTTVAFLGGIVTILRWTTLSVIAFLRKKLAARRSKRATAVGATRNDCEGRQIEEEERTPLFIKLKKLLLNLNFFEDPDEESVWHLHNQHLSTRMFLFLMVSTLSCLILVTLLSHTTETVIVKQPSVDVYLQLEAQSYSQTLVCPCTSISNEYKSFISFQPIFHQICSSIFLTQDWLNYLTPNTIIYSRDLRAIGYSFFPALASFCNLSSETINNELFSFNSRKYATQNVQPPDLFKSTTHQFIIAFERMTKNEFMLQVATAQQSMSGNALFSAAQTNYFYGLSTLTNSSDLLFSPHSYNPDDNNSSVTCSCKFSPDNCDQSTGIYTFIRRQPVLSYTLPGFRVGCSVVGALFASSLECFFEQSCLDTIYNLTYLSTDTPLIATAMPYNSTQSLYNMTTKIQEIVNNLMVENLNGQTSFNSYFKQCNPETCTYTFRKQADIHYMVATIFGLIGGLTTMFRILIPPLVKFSRRKKRPPVSSEESAAISVMSTRISHLRKLLTLIKKKMLHLNLFANPNKRSEDQMKRQRISTRVFIFVFSLTLIVLIVYLSLQNITRTVSIDNPTVAQFNSLYLQYRQSVECKCTTLSIEYQSFMSLQQTGLHPICSSDLINFTSPWTTIDYPTVKKSYGFLNNIPTNVDDFRHISSSFFQVIQSLCELSIQTIDTELLTFESTAFITPNLIFNQQFNVQTDQFITQFIENTVRSLTSALLLTNNLTHGNMLISALSTDSILTHFPDYYIETLYYDYVYDYDREDQIYNSSTNGVECDCQRTEWCSKQAIVYDINATRALFRIPGVYVGCYMMEAVLQSDLRCFFDVECLTELTNQLGLHVNVSGTVLDSNATRYQSTTPLLGIVSNLMVDRWINQTSYENYFNACHPTSCIATYTSRSDTIYIVTTVIGLIGGLTKVYMWIVPLMVTSIRRFLIPTIRRRSINRNRVISFEENAQAVV